MRYNIYIIIFKGYDGIKIRKVCLCRESAFGASRYNFSEYSSSPSRRENGEVFAY